MINNVNPETSSITYDDVLVAIARTGGDLNLTNASKLRSVIGRGSFTTIQRFLDRAREAAAPAPSIGEGDIPAPPKNVLAHLWGMAYVAAKACYLDEIRLLTAERDRALSDLQISRDSLEDMSAQLDFADGRSLASADQCAVVTAQCAAAVAQCAAAVAERDAVALVRDALVADAVLHGAAMASALSYGKECERGESSALTLLNGEMKNIREMYDAGRLADRVLANDEVRRLASMLSELGCVVEPLIFGEPLSVAEVKAAQKAARSKK